MDCVKCGKCKAVCPTYELFKREDLSPRGRVHLSEIVLRGKPDASDVQEALFSCLVCMACEEVCPQFVPVTSLIKKARERVRRAKKEVIGRALPLVEKSLKLKRVKVGSSEKECAVFVGCVVASAMPHLIERMVNVLVCAGYSVFVPEEQFCCGHPFSVVGLEDKARMRVEENIRVFGESREVVTFCSSCASYLKRHYPWKVRDFMEVLGENYFLFDLKSHREVAFHIPCHLVRGQDVDPTEPLREMGFTVLEQSCCGFGAGMVELARKVLEGAVAKGCRSVATSCPACVLQLKRASKEYGFGLEVDHILEFIC